MKRSLNFPFGRMRKIARTSREQRMRRQDRLPKILSNAGVHEALQKVYVKALFAVPYNIRLKLDYLRRFKKWPQVRDPKGHMEKLLARTLFDTDPLLASLSSKVDLKTAVASRLNGTAVRIPRLLWGGDGTALLSEFMDLDLTTRWVLKPNNLGGGLVLRGSPSTTLTDVKQFLRTCHRSYRDFSRFASIAWRESVDGFLIEEHIETESEFLNDYKVHVFGGEPRVLSLYQDREGQMSSQHWALPDQRLFKLGPEPWASPKDIPNLEMMLSVAPMLTFGLPYVRIDFYVAFDQIWFGEVTPFPSFGGLGAYPEIDRQLGRWWPNHPGRKAGRSGL